MIRPIEWNDLPVCLEVIQKGFETVELEFGITVERGWASLPYEKLTAKFESGILMFGYFANNKMVGYLSMEMFENDVCRLDGIVVLPEYRKKGYGKKLLDFCKLKAKELGANKIRLGMIDDNKRLRKWYEENGFTNVGCKKYDNAPYTVGKMECVL